MRSFITVFIQVCTFLIKIFSFCSELNVKGLKNIFAPRSEIKYSIPTNLGCHVPWEVVGSIMSTRNHNYKIKQHFLKLNTFQNSSLLLRITLCSCFKNFNYFRLACYESKSVKMLLAVQKGDFYARNENSFSLIEPEKTLAIK